MYVSMKFLINKNEFESATVNGPSVIKSLEGLLYTQTKVVGSLNLTTITQWTGCNNIQTEKLTERVAYVFLIWKEHIDVYVSLRTKTKRASIGTSSSSRDVSFFYLLSFYIFFIVLPYFILFCFADHSVAVFLCLCSLISMARTRIARLPWMIRTLFPVPTKFFQWLKKTNI